MTRPPMHLAERSRLESVETLSPVLPALHEPDVEEHREVLRDRRVREPRTIDEVTNRELAAVPSAEGTS